MITNEVGTLTYVNPAWSKLYGYSQEEALGQTPRILHSGAQSQAFYKEMWDSILDPTNANWKGELINRTKSGKQIPVLLSITAFRSDDQKKILGYMSIAVDLSVKKEQEAQIIHQDRLHSIGLLASGLAHEIGTPLGVIRGRAEFLMIQTKNSAIEKDLKTITLEIDRVSKVIYSLLRLNRNVNDLLIEKVNLDQSITAVTSLMTEDFKLNKVKFDIKVSKNANIKADSTRLEQTLLNLLLNAKQALQKKKASYPQAEQNIIIEAIEQNEGDTIISVTDSGCGIPEEDMKKIFKPFFTTRDIGEGTGLGLAIVAQLVREMNGKIIVKSTVDRGTTVSMTFKTA